MNSNPEVLKIVPSQIIKPNRLILNKVLYPIEKILNPKCLITQYFVELIDNKLQKVILKNIIHPNCDPSNNNYCLPEQFKGSQFGPNLILFIEHILSCYNLDSCYFNIWNDIVCSQIKGTQLEKGN